MDASTTESHPFDRAMALAPQTPAPGADGMLRLDGRTSADYANMVGPYGGITAAQALQAVLLHPARLGEPVAFTGNFAAALADGDFCVDVQPARTNRSTQHWLVTTRQAGAVVFTATVVTARRRDTWGATDARMPTAPPPDELPPMPPLPHPRWLARYDMRWIEGAMPRTWDGTEHPDSLTRLWVRDAPPRRLDFPGLLALCDVFYPRVWLRRATLTPIGTVSFTVYFHAGAEDLAVVGTGHLLAEARAQRFHQGYFDQSGALWRRDRTLLATTHQLVYYRE